MRKHELEEQLREQLEESKELIVRLLDHLDDLFMDDKLAYRTSVGSLVYRDAEKLLERLNEK